MYIDTLDIIIKQLGNTEGTLAYITWGLIWQTKSRGIPKLQDNNTSGWLNI